MSVEVKNRTGGRKGRSEQQLVAKEFGTRP